MTVCVSMIDPVESTTTASYCVRTRIGNGVGYSLPSLARGMSVYDRGCVVVAAGNSRYRSPPGVPVTVEVIVVVVVYAHTVDSTSTTTPAMVEMVVLDAISASKRTAWCEEQLWLP